MMLRSICCAAMGVTFIGFLYGQDTRPNAGEGTYRNPLSLNDPKTGPAVSCPDPAIIKERKAGFDTWFLY